MYKSLLCNLTGGYKLYSFLKILCKYMDGQTYIKKTGKKSLKGENGLLCYQVNI